MSDAHAVSYATDGYLLVRGLLDPRHDIQHLKESYGRLIDVLAYVYLSENYRKALDGYAGPEIAASPIYHVHVKLAPRHLQEVEAVAKANGQDNPALEGLFLDNKLLHSATQNTSADDYRWAFNFRYLRAGETSGRPFLPGFVARSRSAPDSELHNPHLWSTLWDRALAHSVQHGVPCSYQDLREGKLGDEEAASITARWRLGRTVGAQGSAGNGARS